MQHLRRHAQPRAQKLGDSDARLYALAAWREAPYYTEAERAALALAEAETRLSDRAEAVTGEVWKRRLATSRRPRCPRW